MKIVEQSVPYIILGIGIMIIYIMMQYYNKPCEKSCLHNHAHAHHHHDNHEHKE